MKSQIYLDTFTRSLHIKQLNEFVWVYFNKLLPQFSDVDSEANIVSDNYWNDVMSLPADENDDPSIFAESAMERGLEHYMMLDLGLYTVTAAWHATLFEFFHQQVRLFLYNEMQHSYKIELRDFCNNFKDVIDVFNEHNLNLSTLGCWETIVELQTICNVIKHGEGSAADKLREMAPHRFRNQDDIDLFDLYKTTLLEKTLQIDEKTLDVFRNSVVLFWTQLPERCYSNDY